MQARKSNPADPGVEYSGKGIAEPIRGLRILTFKSIIN